MFLSAKPLDASSITAVLQTAGPSPPIAQLTISIGLEYSEAITGADVLVVTKSGLGIAMEATWTEWENILLGWPQLQKVVFEWDFLFQKWFTLGVALNEMLALITSKMPTLAGKVVLRAAHRGI